MEISADVQEAVEHQRHVCEDVAYKSTFTVLYFVIRNLSGSGSGSYALVPTSTNQPLSTGHARDGNPSAKPGRPDIVPLRPAPPSKPVDSSRTAPIVRIT